MRKQGLHSTFFVTSLAAIATIPVYAAVQQASKPNANNQLIAQSAPAQITLVSYAVTKEAYSKIIPKFVAKWKKEKGQDITIKTSYGGSGTQTRAVIDGLEADVVALALGLDVNKIEKAGLIKPSWQKRSPNNAIVTHSVVAFETRKGNPKKIKTWNDLTKPGVQVITGNPKTSGGARWNFLGIWGSVAQNGANEAKKVDFVSKVYKNVPFLPKDSREASNAFYQKNQGDVLLNYENEVILAAQKGETSPDYIVPATNISIDAPVAVVDKVVDKHKTRAIAEAFVKYLFTNEAQEIFAQTGFRPVNRVVAKQYEKKFPKVTKLYTVSSFGGWDAAQKKFFDEGAIFDQIFRKFR